MKKRNKLRQLLEIEYPIIQAGMPWVSNAELAAAVSNAGGLGLITPTAAMPLGVDVKDNLRSQIQKARAFCERPLGVSLYLTNPEIQSLIDIAIEEGISLIVTAGSSPALYTGYIKDRGVKVLHLVGSVRHAKGAEAHGVDAVIAEGYEGGGLRGKEELPTFVLVPQIVDAVEIPVVASGGVTDARGFIAALALGADGVHVGTRFVATEESAAHPRYKEAILSAIDSGTTILDRQQAPIRVLKEEGVAKLRQAGGQDTLPEPIEAGLPMELVRKAFLEGKLEEGVAYCGASAGLVNEIVSAEQVVRDMVEGMAGVLSRLS